jgi:hypothetical protein
MLKGAESACINHPTVHATVRCKQCSRPICDACVVPGPLGRYCSEACKEKHAHFHQQVQRLDARAGTASFTKVKTAITTLIVFLVVLAVAGFVITIFEVPILYDIVLRIREAIGI